MSYVGVFSAHHIWDYAADVTRHDRTDSVANQPEVQSVERTCLSSLRSFGDETYSMIHNSER